MSTAAVPTVVVGKYFQSIQMPHNSNKSSGPGNLTVSQNVSCYQLVYSFTWQLINDVMNWCNILCQFWAVPLCLNSPCYQTQYVTNDSVNNASQCLSTSTNVLWNQKECVQHCNSWLLRVACTYALQSLHAVVYL